MNPEQRSRLLVFSPSIRGGIAEHTWYQARALAKIGVVITCLAPRGFLANRKADFEIIECLSADVPAGTGRLRRRFWQAWNCLWDRWVLAGQIVRRRPDLVLLDSYVEYLSPLWVWPHWILARLGGVRYGANLHDPVRSYQIGPAWWHALSVRLAYQPLAFVLVHDELADRSVVPVRVRVVRVPHGVYDISGSAVAADAIRRRWGVPDSQKVFLSFGFVRDEKNLDLAIRALARVPQAFLVVAGSVASTKDRPFSFYRRLAAECAVADRCRFFEGFVTDEELGQYFSAADFVLLTYSMEFHSQSGVLNLAVCARKPVLASAAPSALLQSVSNFALGLTVPPDSLDGVVSGMLGLLAAPPRARWDDYVAASAWQDNARGVLEAAGLAAV